MRRKFIIILLGIICASTLSSLFSALPERQPNKLLLNVASGIVGAGNFTYWHLGYTGPLSIELRSLSGDADLYVAYHMRPGYEVSENEYSSTTCGLDVVYIPDDYLRPIGVGIFGHWAYEQSEYKIRVYQDNTPVIYPRVMAGEETSYKPNEYPGTVNCLFCSQPISPALFQKATLNAKGGTMNAELKMKTNLDSSFHS
ncbi:UPF0669 protein C6orf120 homolog isoform X1 [Bombyx mori]|uniref:Uncharacterized protein n=1 Tax=Bombyx mori TaxID=7091 RepID=A0A8R2HPE5_BOMMO|nr:UPF0669 protein C6orf120 homolog isoform X1 [Bombyx mori]